MKPEDHLKQASSRQVLVAGILLALSLAGWAMFHVWSRSMAVEMGYALSEQRRVNEQLSMDHNALELEISTLKGSKRLELIARTELGLQVPKPEQVVYLWKEE